MIRLNSTGCVKFNGLILRVTRPPDNSICVMIGGSIGDGARVTVLAIYMTPRRITEVGDTNERRRPRE